MPQRRDCVSASDLLLISGPEFEYKDVAPRHLSSQIYYLSSITIKF